MWKPNRWLATTAAIGLTAILVSFGCGGSSFLTEMPGGLSSEDTYPVMIRIGVESKSTMAGVSKDAGGIGIGGLEAGDVSGPEDWYRIVPYITWAATTTGPAPTYPICATQAECDAGGYTAYLVCNGSWVSDIAKQHYIGVCSGQLPEAAKTHTVDNVVHFYNYIRTTQLNGTKAVVRLDADWENWDEIEASIADMLLDGNQWNIAYQTFDPGGDLAGLDLQGCDGQVNAVGNTPMSIGLDGNNVPIDEFDETLGAPIDNIGTKDFAKGVKIEAAMGDDILDSEGITAKRCHFELSFDNAIPLSSFPETVDMERGDFTVCGLYCNDLAVNCDASYCGAGTMDSSLITFYDNDLQPITNGASDVMLGPEMNVSFGADMAEPISASNIFIEVTALPAALAENPLDAGDPYIHSLDLVFDAFVNDDQTFEVIDAYEAQLLPFALEIAGGLKDAAGNVLMDVARVDAEAGCALSDTFNVDSSDPVECWDPSVTYANFFPVTLNTWAQIDAESALGYDLVNGMLLYRDSVKGDDTQQAAFISKPIELPSSSWQLEAVVSNASGFKAIDVGTMSDALSFNVMSDVTSGYTMGLQTIDIAGVKTQTCYALYMEDGAPQGGSYLDDCDTESDFVFRLSYNVGAKDVVAEVSFDDGASWHDIVTEGVQFPTAPQAALNYAALAGNVYASIGIMSADDGTTKNNTADIEQVRFYGLDSLAGAAVAQFSDGDYEEPDTFAMNLGGVLLDVQDGGNWNSIDPNGTNARMDQNVVAIFDESISPLDFANMTSDNVYLAPAQPLTGQAATVPGAVYATIMDPGGEYENMRAAYVEITDAASVGQQVGDSGAYHYQKQDYVELHIKGQVMENGLAQRNHYVHPFSPACALSDHFYQDLRTQCYYTVSNTDVSTAIAAGGSVLEITRTGAAGVYEISKPAIQNSNDEWVLSIGVNIDNMDRTWGSTDSVLLSLTDAPDGSGEGYHLGIIAYDSLTGDGDYEMTCFAGRTNNLGQFVEAMTYGPCDAYDGQDLAVQMQASLNPNAVTPMYSLDGGQTLNPFPFGDLGLLNWLSWTDLYFNVEVTFSPTSSMQVNLDRINSLGHIGRSAAELDTSNYMVEPWGRPPKPK